jgi:hypothetical protein
VTHLTIGELELWLSGQLPADRSGHLGDCPDCARMARGESLLVTAIGNLPHFAPRAGFENRVMQAVRLPDPAWYQSLARVAQRAVAGPRRWALAGGAGVLSFASLAAVIVWGASNLPLIEYAASWLVTVGLNTALGAVQTLTMNGAAWAQANTQMLIATAIGVCGSYIVAFAGYRYLLSAGRGAHATARVRIG